MVPVGSRLTLRRGYVQTPARPGSASAADGDGVAAVALSGPGGDLLDRGSDLDLDVDGTTSEGIQQPGYLARRVCSGLPGTAASTIGSTRLSFAPEVWQSWAASRTTRSRIADPR
jgi:hypothetical protein